MLRQAATELAAAQATDGSFPVESGGMPGAPASYGTALATVMAMRSLAVLDARRHAHHIARADAWIARAQPANTLDAAALLWGNSVRRDCLDRLLATQGKDGGWGAEPFDTAIALLALTQAKSPPSAREKAREFLVRTQDKEGAWPETTRPAGGISYAERMSTAGWVTYALLMTRR